jgi:hypothetical protein
VVGFYTASIFVDNNLVNIRITIDGGTATTISGNSYPHNWLRGFPQGVYTTGGVNSFPAPGYNLGFDSPIHFFKSVLIEVNTTQATTGTLYSAINYSIE